MISRMYSFDIEDAVLFEERGAVILNNIRYWILKNQSSNQNYHKGHYWTYNTIAGFKNYHPYLTEKQISTTLLKLEKSGVLITDNFNKLSYDRTKWYCINEPLLRKMKLDLKALMLESEPNEENENLNTQKDSFLEENITISVEKLSQAPKNTNLPNGKMDFTKKENVNLPNGKMTISQKVNTIPDNKTNDKTDNKEKERGEKEKFSPPSLSEVVEFFETWNIKASAENFFNHWESVGWKKSGGLKIVKWQNLVPKWEKDENEFEKNKKPAPAVLNAAPKKASSERQLLVENFKKKTRSFVEQLQADASALETARIKFNKECNHPNEFNSQAVYNEINNYQIWLMVEPHLLSDDDLNKITINDFKRNFFAWFKKQKHGSDLFAETINKHHVQPQLQQ